MATLLAVLVRVLGNKVLRQQSSLQAEENWITTSGGPAIQEEEACFFMVLRCRDRLFSFPPITFADGFQLQADQLGLNLSRRELALSLLQQN